MTEEAFNPALGLIHLLTYAHGKRLHKVFSFFQSRTRAYPSSDMSARGRLHRGARSFNPALGLIHLLTHFILATTRALVVFQSRTRAYPSSDVKALLVLGRANYPFN